MQKLVPGMEFHKTSPRRFWGKALPPSLQDEYCLNEILPEFGIMKPSLLFNREQREVFHEGTGKHADSTVRGHPLVRVDLDSFHPAAGGSLS